LAEEGIAAGTAPANIRRGRMSGSEEIDAGLGEALHENEQEIIQKITQTVAERIQRGPRPALRAAHPKAHGCVIAEFRVENDLPPALAQGVFVPGKSYPTYIRFSNGNPDAGQPDAKRDVRGMAIKLLGVPGKKILEDEREAKTQDFLLVNYPVFFVDDPARYLKLIERTASSGLLAKLGQLLAIGLRGALIARSMTSSKIASPLEARYWSQLAYRLGDPPHKQAVKFSARPRGIAAAAIPKDPSPNYLRETLITQLEAGEALFDFEVQPRTSPDMSVETSMIEWNEQDAPFFKVATITIPRQRFATPERDQLCENLSFTPWHALPQHRPLGSMNRIRRAVYQTASKLRHELNGTVRTEPDEIPAGIGWP
jgi:hypothetical protein